MAILSDLLDDLRDRLDDDGDVAITRARKLRWINRGIAACWPDIYVRVTDENALVYADGTYSYGLTSDFDGAQVYRVRYFQDLSSGLLIPVTDWESARLPSGEAIEFSGNVVPDGATCVVDAVRPVAALSADGDPYEGLAGTEELPVLYAMAIAAGRGLDGRLDYTRYSTRNGQNGVGTAEIEGAANFFMGVFRDLLSANAMAFPAVRG